MKVLYVTAACLLKNTSANMSHNAYVKGLIENGAELDIIMASDSWGEADNKFIRFPGVKYYEYNSKSLSDKMRERGRRMIKQSPQILQSTAVDIGHDVVMESHKPTRAKFRALMKNAYYWFFRPDSLYPLNKHWLLIARKFKSKKEYDLVISNSSPSASHKLVEILSRKGNIRYKRWIQIWEDPWYYDLYGGHSQAILKEEHRLLQAAQEVFYVSPLTVHYQKRYFPDCASKMNVIPLPYFKFGGEKSSPSAELSFGYFGDYYSHVRNILPFYEALAKGGYKGYIYGDSDLRLQSTEKITVSDRVTLDVLENVQNNTAVLVHLCNLRGGQIPGKIYHYSATNKPIIFILDGTEDECTIIKDYFSKYDRFIFCENTINSIAAALDSITSSLPEEMVVEAFSPETVVKVLLAD